MILYSYKSTVAMHRKLSKTRFLPTLQFPLRFHQTQNTGSSTPVQKISAVTANLAMTHHNYLERMCTIHIITSNVQAMTEFLTYCIDEYYVKVYSHHQMPSLILYSNV